MSRPLRADARRNRARVLEVAAETFAAEGLSVPVHEIARRAGVGTGTVSRHFPTKESLFQAILLDAMEQLVRHADELAAAEEPGEAFFAFFARVAETGAANRGLVDALAGAGFDVEAVTADGRYDVMGAWRGLLEAAQRAGAVRPDVELADVKALLNACVARERPGPDPVARARMLAVVRAGLRP
ncbi:HTH-type transcriptional repressor KstR2 [Nonomuraea coxensis DSM 45129]|uniref:HTH-type transcriptional repressor KstR2 n=1 Tax=Nonomuraea coxensis DSM 45129 TaxID=1122611 RepID=A0ABX8TSW2_9ACTN|nr:TetR/AcrR family transcriptional regulator [Nonomuraea coxensis]QYC38321.1 HTH-type transcriptional repressor KstR2 [Nonomuraea coxensis DSM 45129]